MEFTEVRCPVERKHSIKGIEYTHCGSLLGGVSDGGEAILRCPTCGFVHAYYSDEGVLEFGRMRPGKIKFNKKWRHVYDE